MGTWCNNGIPTHYARGPLAQSPLCQVYLATSIANSPATRTRLLKKIEYATDVTNLFDTGLHQ